MTNSILRGTKISHESEVVYIFMLYRYGNSLRRIAYLRQQNWYYQDKSIL